jgi:hypothetical protein
VSDKLSGDELRSIAALCNKDGVENKSTSGQIVIGFLLLISASEGLSRINMYSHAGQILFSKE